MNHSISRFLLLISISFCSVAAYAQTDLKTALQGKNTLDDIMEVVDLYYQGQPEDWQGPDGGLPRMLFWKRWEWFTSGRLGPGGEFVDYPAKIDAALEYVEKTWPERRDINPYWFSKGPATTANGIGRADRIAFHPSDTNIMYLASPAGGLWRTTNAGSSWTALSDYIPSPGISGIVVNWANPNHLYILTGDGDSEYGNGFVAQFNYVRKSQGVLKSTDNGATWKAAGVLDTNDFIGFRLIQDPTNSSVLLAATDLGVYRTDDAGSSWTRTLSDDIYDVEFKPGTNRAYACSTTAIYYSSDGGINWNNSVLNVPLNGARRTELAVTPINTSRVYLLVGDVDAPGTFDGVYRSTNSGLNYTQRATTPNILGRADDGSDDLDQIEYDHALAVSSTNSNVVITGGVRIWRSINGATSFSYASYLTHEDIHELAYNPLTGTLFACTDGGLYRSYTDGLSWSNLYSGYTTSQYFHMTGTSLDADYILGGLQDNGVKIRKTNSTSWLDVSSGDGFDVAFQPDDETNFYATVNRKLYRFTNGGNTKNNITPSQDSLGNFSWFGTIVTHISDPDIIFAGYKDVYKSEDQGDTWTNKGVSGSWAMATCPSNSTKIYAAGGSSYNSGTGGLYRSNNLGDDWVNLHTNTGFPSAASISKITDVDVHPGNSTNVYATIGGFSPGLKVFRSTNSGGSWTNWSGSLPDIPINCVTVAANGDVYIGTDIGVFYRKTTMSDWMPFDNALPNVPVTDLYINETNSKIWASTFGRGVWRTDVATACPTDLALDINLKGDYLYQASNSITATANIIGGVGTSVHFKANNLVLLNPGFRAYRHTVFSAYIEGCGSGGIPDPLAGEEEEIVDH
jgi:hypothetical protein